MNENGANVLLDKPFAQRIEVTDTKALLAAIGQPMVYDAIADDLPEDGTITATKNKDIKVFVGAIAPNAEVNGVSICIDRGNYSAGMVLSSAQARTLAALLLREAAKVEAQR
jgi:uncharacterized protein with ATP-grasp and redox domains